MKNYGESITLNELAELAGLSEGHFCRLFKRFTGATPIQYMNRRRIAKSCEYLSRTNKKIADIATLCGYNNISYFNRVFLSFMGGTPSAYHRKKIL